jgi:hypothetical protein
MNRVVNVVECVGFTHPTGQNVGWVITHAGV